MSSLSCALCLDNDTIPTAQIAKAITIANGQAVCPRHFATVSNAISVPHGQRALVTYRRPR